jgi:hypothetical protein
MNISFILSAAHVSKPSQELEGSSLLPACFFLLSFLGFCPEDGSDIFLRTVSWVLSHYVKSEKVKLSL